MFDRIAPAYDRLNHILSWGLDRRWRRHAAQRLDLASGARVLDLAVGTGDLLIEILHQHPQVNEGLGVDLSEEMLARCRVKLKDRQLSERARLLAADALDLPFPDDHFDALTMAFGIRNTTDRCVALTEMLRVVKPGGQVVILEFALPGNRLIRWIYRIYLRIVLPLVGGLLSGRPGAYRYLFQTIEGFHAPEDFRDLMLEAGFDTVQIVSLSYGTVCVYDGRKGG